jgi:hypothetical protein
MVTLPITCEVVGKHECLTGLSAVTNAGLAYRFSWNDGMVPWQSASMAGHSNIMKHSFFDYDHLHMKDGNGTSALFDTMKSDLMSSYPDADNDGYTSDVDCDDNNVSINPGASEICSDGLDNDCNGYTDAKDSNCFPPDLIVTTVTFTPVIIVRGNIVSVAGSTKNKGKGVAGPSVTNYYLSIDNIKSKKDILLTSYSVQALNAAASSPGTTSVTIPANPRPGSYYVIGCADDMKQVKESKEGNNCRVSGKMIKVRK